MDEETFEQGRKRVKERKEGRTARKEREMKKMEKKGRNKEK